MSKESEEATAALEAAALLELAMSESHSPVGELGGALARMSRVLSGCCTLVEGQRSAALDEETRSYIQRTRELFEREVQVCIESLQFHDRLMQQLTHAKKCLATQSADPAQSAAKRAVDSWMTRHAAEGSIELF
jgi:hypothetical protein